MLTELLQNAGALAIGFAAAYTLDTIIRRSRSISKQVAKDTCKVHGEFCCGICFDIFTTKPAEVRMAGYPDLAVAEIEHPTYWAYPEYGLTESELLSADAIL